MIEMYKFIAGILVSLTLLTAPEVWSQVSNSITFALSPHKDAHKSGGSDAFVSTDLIEAVVKRLQTSGGTNLTVDNVVDGEILKRSGTTIVSIPVPTGGGPHKDTHKSGGTDAFTSTDLIEAVVKRLRETGGADLTAGAIVDGEYLKRSGTTITSGTPTGGGGGTATSLQESGGQILPIGPISPFEYIVRDKDGVGNPRVAGHPRGIIPHKVCHPGVLENSDPNTWMSINVTGVDSCDISAPSAVRMFYFIRYMVSSPGIKFRFAEGALISTWGGWGSTPYGSDPMDQTTTDGSNSLAWGSAGWGHPNTRTLFLYAAKDGSGSFTLQFAPVGTGTARINTGTFASIIRAKELDF